MQFILARLLACRRNSGVLKEVGHVAKGKYPGSRSIVGSACLENKQCQT